MMAFLGWIALATVGAPIAFLLGACLIFVLNGLKGDLEIVPLAMGFGAICAVAWLIFVFWIAPITISLTGVCA